MEVKERVSKEKVEHKNQLAEKVKTLPKTETYEGRQRYAKENPEDVRHQDINNLIDNFLIVALDMLERKADKKLYDWSMYCSVQGNCFMTGNGILQLTGCYDEGKLLPFFTDHNKESYSMRQSKVLKDLHDWIFWSDEATEADLVAKVESVDMWHNC